MDQPVEQLHVEIMLELHVNKDVLQLILVIVMLKLLENVETDQPVDQLHVEIKKELYVYKDVQHLHHHQDNSHQQMIVIVMLML
jgi:hypothetical protein